MTGPDNSSRYTINVLQRALDVLDALGDGPCSLTELSQRTGISKPTVFRILANLEGRGFVERVASNGHYTLGFSLVRLSARVIADLDLRTIARPALERLQAEFAETVNLAVPRQDSVIYIDICQSEHGLRMAASVGARDDIHSTSIGKAIASCWDEKALDAFLERTTLAAKTANTIVDPDALREELRRTRERGYAIDDGENEPGARCVGAPIFDHRGEVIAALSVSGPASRVTPDRIPHIAARLIDATNQISENLGYHLPRSEGVDGRPDED